MSFLHPLILGVFATLFALVLELVFSLLPGAFTPLRSTLDGNMPALAFFALAEELAKALFLRRLLQTLVTHKAGKASIVIAFAFGFIATEALIAIGTRGTLPPQAMAGIAVLHAITIFGYAYTIHRTKKLIPMAIAIAIATMAHFLYNLFLA